MNPFPEDVATFLGRSGDISALALAESHLPIVTAFVRAYVRGNGFDEAGEANDDLAVVITAATARLVDNPAFAKTESAGPFSRTPGQLNGFTLPELAVLHLYRRRTA